MILASENKIEIILGTKDRELPYSDIVKIGKAYGYDLSKKYCGYCYFKRVTKGHVVYGLRFFK